MGWEVKARGAGAGYFYRSVWRPEGPRKIYYGRSGHALDHWEYFEEASAAAPGERAAAQARDGLARRLDNLADQIESLLRAWLVAWNFHVHRGEWRQRRWPMADEERQRELATVWANLLHYNEELKGPTVRRASLEGYLRKHLAQHRELWDRVLGAQQIAEQEIVAAIASGDALQEQKVREESAERVKKMLGADSDPLEVILAEQVVLGDLATKLALVRVARTSASPPVARADRRFYESANRTFARAVAALELYRAKRLDGAGGRAKAKAKRQIETSQKTTVPGERPGDEAVTSKQ